MDNVHSSLSELFKAINLKCPQFRPAIFPNYFNLNDLAAIEKHNDSIAYFTELDYTNQEIKVTGLMSTDSIGKKLNSVEIMLKTLIIAEDSEIDMLCAKFFELNGLDGENVNKKSYLNEVYNLAYSARVLISNIPSFRVTIDNQSLPLDSNKNIDQLIAKLSPKIQKPSAAKQSKKNKNGDSDDSSDEETDEQVNQKKKKRRRGRG